MLPCTHCDVHVLFSSSQTSYAYNVAFLLTYCYDRLTFAEDIVQIIKDACTILETPDLSFAVGVASKGHRTRASLLIDLRIGCLAILVAAIKWPLFREADISQATKRESQPGLLERIVKVPAARSNMVT